MIISNNFSNQNKPTFGMKIRFSADAYNALPLEELESAGKYVGYPWTINEAKLLDKGYSAAASVCTICVVQAKDMPEAHLMHFIPSKHSIRTNTEYISSIVNKFKEFSKFVEAFLYGARIDKEFSMGQANEFIQLFNDSKVDYSAFLGQGAKELHGKTSCPGVDLFVSVPEQQHIVSFTDGSEAKNSNDLRRIFTIFKPSPNHIITFE